MSLHRLPDLSENPETGRRHRAGSLRAAAARWLVIAARLSIFITAASKLPGCVRAQAQDYTALREEMVTTQIAGRGVKDQRVLEAVRRIPRHLFVQPELQAHAYEDNPLPIGSGQTISQPYIVALMTELLRPRPADRILEIGTGSGYQAAVVSRLAHEVYSIEIVPALASEAQSRLRRLGFSNVTVKAGDGYRGWPEHAPFDGILVTAAPPEIPPALVAQLRRGGRMVLPVGKPGKIQNLLVLEKSLASGEIVGRTVIPVQFVPMVKEPAPEKGP